MPNVASVLKEEITRLARKEVAAQTEALRTAINSHRSQIVELRRKNEALEKQIKRLEKRSSDSTPRSDRSDSAKNRFSSKGLATHRQRLGLSAADFGALIGASSLSVYKWEKGEARPRDKYIKAIAEARRIGKREAAKRLGLSET